MSCLDDRDLLLAQSLRVRDRKEYEQSGQLEAEQNVMRLMSGAKDRATAF